jgi:hypothetical protein
MKKAPALRCRGSARDGHKWPAKSRFWRGHGGRFQPKIMGFSWEILSINRMVCSDSVKHPKKFMNLEFCFRSMGTFPGFQIFSGTGRCPKAIEIEYQEDSKIVEALSTGGTPMFFDPFGSKI